MNSSPKPTLIAAALTYGTFPLVFGGVMGLALYAVARGSDPVFTAMGLTAAVVVLLLVLERVHPYQKEWLHSHGDLRTDLFHNLVNFWIPEVYTVAFVGAFTVAAAWLSNALGVDLWPRSWPLLAQLLLALVIAELGTYWIHRVMHEHPLLWRFHAAHHSAPRLYWLNAGRFHPLDLFAQQFLGATPLVLLGADMRVIALHTLFTAVHGMFQHANVDIKLGPLNWFFSMAELHRWHHSKHLAEANTNYGANLIFWDIVFRSRFLPRDRQPPTEIGIESLPNFPGGYWAQLLSPFRWKKIEASARSK
ncbi:MAG: sterol desaturase family protein [Deltaproteobacteria bacterium]|nr:sterol desaturase family protein [Deltaproteobacteria bacterium]NNK07888.1 sterol desaturase family protein [Myxococcales bacterium]